MCVRKRKFPNSVIVNNKTIPVNEFGLSTSETALQFLSFFGYENRLSFVDQKSAVVGGALCFTMSWKMMYCSE